MLSSLLRLALTLSCCVPLTQAGPSRIRLESRDPSFNYASEKVRGVNLGGWLVLEPWITPSIFDARGDSVIDEWTLCQSLGSQALDTLSSHWNSWITASDFAAIAAAGLNHVRIPIGYWAIRPLNGEPYVQGQLEILDSAIGWARNNRLKVIIDLHGAPHSQNGYDNSGRRGPINWQKASNSVNQTLDAIQDLAQRYAGDSDVVTAIELLNEPNIPGGVQLGPLQQYYYDGWGRTRDYSKNLAIVIHDGFNGPTSWNGFMGPASGFNFVILDTHHYEIFDNNVVGYSIDQHVKTACDFGSQISDTDKWTIVGEWTGALTDCAKYLNGRGFGARYDGSYPGSSSKGSCAGKSQGSVAALSATDKSNLRRFIEVQLDAFEKNTGWIYWTWHTEGAPEWDMQQQIAEGVFPQPLTAREFENRCPP